MKQLKKLNSITLMTILVISVAATAVFALSKGTKVSNVQIKDANDKPATIPHFGKKVLIVMYNDVDVADQNDPFANVVKDAKIDGKKLKAIGVANMKDAPWKPNSIIRHMVRKKIKQFPGTIILTDPDYTLRNAWGLGNCNEKSVAIVVGKDKKVHYYKKGKLSAAESQEALAIIKKLVK